MKLVHLIPMFHSYNNQSIDLDRNSVDGFLCVESISLVYFDYFVCFTVYFLIAKGTVLPTPVYWYVKIFKFYQIERNFSRGYRNLNRIASFPGSLFLFKLQSNPGNKEKSEIRDKSVILS